jgi:two-component system, response regulator, stage 0 sporulation protein F
MAKILLVDDEKHIRQRYTEELSRDRYEVMTLDSGDRLLERICFLQPDVVVLDIRLGNGWDGLDLLQDIKNRFFDLPVILCTAYDTFKYDPRSAAADYYVVKGDNLSELKDKIRMTVQTPTPNFQTRVTKPGCDVDEPVHQLLLGLRPLRQAKKNSRTLT